MAVTQNTYTGNGSTVLYSFTFPYLETTDIKVSLNGTVTTAYTFDNATTIRFNTAPANGVAIRIYRQTDDSELSATFYPGSAIRSQDLNDNFTQNLYVTQEVNNNSVNIDGSNPMVGPLNMNGFQITNLPVPAVDTNAATKKYVDDRFGNLDIPGHTRWRKVATASQTTFSGTGDYGGVLAYSPTREQVYINGALQQRGVDYAADNGTSVVFTVGLTVGDVVDIICVNNLTNSSVSNAGNITYSGQFTGQTARTVAAKLGDVVSVKDFGAVGDGVADDTAAIQNALNSSAHTVHLVGGQTYKVTSAVTVPANKVIVGNEATITNSSHFTVFTFSNGGGIYRTKLTGPGNASYVSGSTAIKCSGTNNAPAAPTYVTGPTISDCTISGFGEYGVLLQYVRNASIRNNTISNVGYTGVGGASCEEVTVESNKITGITPGSAGGDAYGVFIDRFNGTSETAEPRSYRCVISNNIINSVISSTGITGHGIDTHGGVEFIIDGNQIKNCQGGIWVTASSISGVQSLGPKRCVITNNVITSTYFVNYGILLYGARTGATVNDYAEECVLSNNIITGHGSKTSDTIPGVFISITKNCTITGNVIKESGGNSLLLDFSNININVSSNTFIDPQATSYAAPACIRVYSIDNRGLIGDNVYRFENAALATYVAVNSVRIESGLTGLDLDFTRSSFLGIDATHLTFTALTAVRNNGLMTLSGQSTIVVSSGVGDGITDVTFNKRFPYSPTVTFTLRNPYNQGGKFPIIGIDTAVPVSETGFRIYARPYDGSTWTNTGSLTFDWTAS